MRRALLLSLFVSSGCFRFDDRLAACRDDAGVWICPRDASASGGGGGGATGGGTGGGSARITVDLDGGELICTGGAWCWEHPRTTGVKFLSVWARNADDLFVGGEHGTLLHYDGATWTALQLDQNDRVGSLCGTEGREDVYIGLTATDTPTRLYVTNGSNVTPISGFTQRITDLDCGPNALWVSEDHFVSRVAYGMGGARVEQFALPNEQCDDVTETTGGAIAICVQDTPRRIRLRDATGAQLLELQPDGGALYEAGAIWRSADAGIFFAVNNFAAEVWRYDPITTAANTVWISPFARAVYSASPWWNGWIAVGGGNGFVVESGDAVSVSERQVFTAVNSYHEGVLGQPDGGAFLAGQNGCVSQRTGDNAWTPLTQCDLRLTDFWLGTRALALGSDGQIHERGPTGWNALAPSQGAMAIAVRSDGMIVLLTRTQLVTLTGTLAPRFDEATDWVVAGNDRVLVNVRDGGVIDATLGGTVNGGHPRRAASMTWDESTDTVWLLTLDGDVFSSSQPGVFVRDPIAPTDLLELSASNGQLWGVSTGAVSLRRADGGWETNTGFSGFARILAAGDRAVVIDDDERVPMRVIETNFNATNVKQPPNVGDPPNIGVNGKLLFTGTELWFSQQYGLMRIVLP